MNTLQYCCLMGPSGGKSRALVITWRKLKGAVSSVFLSKGFISSPFLLLLL